MGKRKSELNSKGEIGINAAFAVVILFFIFTGFVSYRNMAVVSRDTDMVVRTHQTIMALADLMSSVKDAETSQRGYILTGDERYLGPYNDALPLIKERMDSLSTLSESGSSLNSRLPIMKRRVEGKVQELQETIDMQRSGKHDQALAIVRTDRGKTEMDALRDQVQASRKDEESIRQMRLEEMQGAQLVAIISGILTGAVGIALAIYVASLVRKSADARDRQEWLQTGQVGLSTAMFGEQRVESLSENILKYLSEYLGAQAAVMYVRDGGVFRRSGGYGLPENAMIPQQFAPGEGLLGQAVKDKRSFQLDDVPDGYLAISSAMGESSPRHLSIIPAFVDDRVIGVFELGYLNAINEQSSELLELSAGPIGIAIRSAIDRTRLQDLLEETQRQSEELQTQSEELRVSNEELEEQSRALKESQARLEQQQAELEQSNSQLEEQAQQLEIQRDDLHATKVDLEAQAKDLERTSRFKSDFLANMSHELRTPLNSSLILSKLLGDNREGNLTDEQIKYARTIEGAGNDLLALINDILDLSKIEAGHMEVNVESVEVENVVGSIQRTFEQMAAQKSLEFSINVGASAPKTIQTDPMRLEQVLKNLLSNAIKFTEKGAVTLDISSAGSQIAFAVRDTGIGISEQQSNLVFEAFRQADGTTNRKYGGTGLGLSISRELAHLLGGQITLESEPGKGSTFTLTVPVALQAIGNTVPVVEVPAMQASRPLAPPSERTSVPNLMNDDRDDLGDNDRVILVVEDDRSFARILLDLAHEHRFKCLIGTTADDGLALANQFLPSAVLLDIGLPDNSGLSVLDRLKHNDRTRHIPVHVVSGNDYQSTAMALGAVGYMLKPVKREELIRAFEGLESLLTQRLRQVLVVEDDLVQLESLRLLLASREVKTIGASSAAECLSLLATTTFDCMVMDLSLPDASGFTLLETLSNEENYSFPPVIVYTGRDLSTEEEQRLRKYSKSIIVKGAKSPERLLDEVTLFLHQVVADLPPEKRQLIEQAKNRDADLENRRILVVEDDIRNVFALTSVLEPRGAKVEIARNGREALEALERTSTGLSPSIDLVLMDIMMPEMDGYTAMREIRKNPQWKTLPIIALTAKAMKNDQELCLEAGANDYVAKPLDVEKLLSLVRVWMRRE